MIKLLAVLAILLIISETCCGCPHLVLGCHPVKEKEDE